MSTMRSANPQVADKLARLLADSYTVYLKTHGFHWNVTGPMFTTLHTLFEQQYSELALAVDEIAERIRAVGERAPGSYAELSELASVEEARGQRSAEEMLRELVNDQAAIVAAARQVVEAAENAGDAASADLGVRRTEGNNYVEAWDRILKRLIAEFGQNVFQSWFARLKFDGVENGMADRAFRSDAFPAQLDPGQLSQPHKSRRCGRTNASEIEGPSICGCSAAGVA